MPEARNELLRLHDTKKNSKINYISKYLQNTMENLNLRNTCIYSNIKYGLLGVKRTKDIWTTIECY